MELHDEVTDFDKQTLVEQYTIFIAVLDYLRDAASGMDGKAILYAGDWRNQTTHLRLHTHITGSPYTLQMWGLEDRVTAIFNRDVDAINPIRSEILELSDPNSINKLMIIVGHYLAIPRILIPKRLVRFSGHKQS
jgi:hypothetical protein